jgi:excinuclease ABC subunit C
VRGRETIKSTLGEISGIGRVREKELLKYFGSVEKMKGASLEDLANAPKMNRTLASKVYDFFGKSEQ